MASSIPSNILGEPISPPPPGQRADFSHPPSRSSEICIAAAVCVPLILIFASLRFYAKIIIKKKRTWDDLTCMLGILAAIGFISVSVATVSGGAYGLHEWDVTTGDLTRGQILLTLVAESIYAPCLWFIKISLFVLYLEIFGLIRWLRYLALIGMVVTGLFYFASMATFLILCSPRDGHSQWAYLMALTSHQCSKSKPLAVVVGAVSVVSDLYLVILPLPAVWSLQLPFRKKIGVSAMFLTGSIACIASVIGLYYRVAQNRTTDQTWVVIPSWLTAIVEMTAGLLVCCMPTAAAVFSQIKGPFSSFLTSSRKGFKSFTRSTSASHHEKLGSSSNTRGDFNLQDNSQAQYEMKKPWSDPEEAWSECQAEPERAANFPPEDTKIRKSTKFGVTRESGRY